MVEVHAKVACWSNLKSNAKFNLSRVDLIDLICGIHDCVSFGLVYAFISLVELDGLALMAAGG